MQYANLGQGYGPLTIQPTGCQSQAVLCVFSKAFIPDYARRPMTYSFNDGTGAFRRELSDRLRRVGTLGGWNKRSAVFSGSRETAGLVLPNAQADDVNMSVFSDLWTFVLVITNVRNSQPFTGIPPVTSKEIFSGYLLDDPVSNTLVSMGHSDAVNGEATLCTTHHTVLNLNDTALSPFTVMSDVDMIPQQTAANIQKNGCSIASLRPDNLVKGITVASPFDTNIQTTPVPLNQGAPTSEEVDTAYAVPVTHMAKLVDSLANSKWDAFGNTSSQTLREATGDAMTELVTSFASRLQPGYSAMINPDVNKQKIRPDMPFKINDIIVAYPDILIQICQQPAGQQVDLVNPMLPTVTNQMSSLISSCLPVLLTEHGFSEISMRYCSYDPNPDGFTRGSYQVYSAVTLCEVTAEVYQAKVQVLLRDIIDNLFGVVLANAGEFNVQLNCSIGGASLVDLTLLDWMSQNQNGYTMVNNRMGGLNSSMIGSYEVSLANQQQLSSIIQDTVNVAASEAAAPMYNLY